MYRVFYFFLIATTLFLFACQGQSKEDILKESQAYVQQGNLRGALVVLKNALEKDPNFGAARLEVGRIYIQFGQPDRALSELAKAEALLGKTDDLVLYKAEAYLLKGQSQNTLELLADFPTKNDLKAPYYVLKGRAHAVEEQWRVAEDSFRRAVALDGGSRPARLNLCRVLEEQGMNKEAQECLREYVTRWPNRREGVLLLAQINIRENRIDAAKQLLEDYNATGNGDAETHYRLGTLYLRNKDFDRLDQTVKMIAESDPQSHLGPLLAGQKALASGHPDKALERLTQAATLNSGILTEYFLGLARYSLGHFEQALNHFQATLDQDAEFQQARIMVGASLLKQKRFEDALISANQVLEKDRQNLQALRLAAGASMALARYDDVDRYMQRAVEAAPERHDIHLSKGALEMAMGEVAASRKTLEAALSRDQSNIQARLYLAADAARSRNYQGAIVLLEQGLTGARTDAVLKNMIGTLFVSQDKSEEARKAFAEAKSAHPQFKAPYFNLARMALKETDFDEALKEFDAVLAFDNKDLTALLNKARLLQISGDSEAARHVLQQAQAIGAPPGYIAFGQFLLDRKEYAQALAVFKEGSVRHPQDITLLELQAHTLRRLDQTEDAFKIFLKIESLQQGRGLPNAVLMYIDAGQNEKALSLVEEQILGEPASPYGYLLASVYHERLGDLEQALVPLEKGLQVVPEAHPIYKRLATLVLRLGQEDRSFSIVNDWISRSPKNYEAHFFKALLLEKRGEVDKAVDSYKESLLLNKNYILALNNLAYLYTDRIGRPQEALPLAKRAVELKPGSAAVLDTLGYVLYSIGDYTEAKKILRKAVELDPSHGDIQFHLAKVLVALDEKAKAKEVLNKALEHKNMVYRSEAEALLATL